MFNDIHNNADSDDYDPLDDNFITSFEYAQNNCDLDPNRNASNGNLNFSNSQNYNYNYPGPATQEPARLKAKTIFAKISITRLPQTTT